MMHLLRLAIFSLLFSLSTLQAAGEYSVFGPTDLQPWALCIDRFDNVYSTDYTRVVKLNRTGHLVQSFTVPGRALFDPRGCHIDYEDNLWIADFGNVRVVKMAPDGTHLLTVWPNATQPWMVGPRSIAVARDGRVFVADTYTGLLYTFDRDGRQLHNFTLKELLYGVAINATSGDVLVEQRNIVVALNGDSGAPLYSLKLASLVYLEGLALDHHGHVYAVDYAAGRGLQLDGRTGATVREFATSPAMKNPHGIAVDSKGNVFVADMEGRRIYKFSPEPSTPSPASA